MKQGALRLSQSARVALFAAALIVTRSATAQATTFEAGGALVGDFNAGGDTLAVLHFADSSTQEITAGQGLIFAAGAGAIFFDEGPHRLETLLNFGLKYSTMQPTSNADLSFVRLPIELLAFYRNDALHFRVGGGASWYVFGSLSGSGAASNLNVDFKPSLGGIVESDFIWNAFSLGIRYTKLTLRPKDIDASLSANTIGIGISYFYQFGHREQVAGAR
jgi:hypothetical protein